MRLLTFSDVHRDLDQAKRLVEMSAEADVVVGAGDYASVHRGLEELIDVLAAIETPTVLIPGNNETTEALREACSDWPRATVLHGEATEIEGVPFFGLGAGVPTTPWDWSFDLTDPEAAAMLESCPPDSVLVVHSPPRGHCDESGAGEHLGSEAVLQAIESHEPRVALCGHIHESWGTESQLGPTRILNLGPSGTWVEA